MRKRSVVMIALAACSAVAATLLGIRLWPVGEARLRADPTDRTLVAEGRVVYEQRCASCHGKNLEGQANWRERLPDGRLPAPPHDASGHTWHHPDETLFRITKEGVAAIAGGNYQSDMPPFKGVLSDSEIWAVLAYIKSAWPDSIRARQPRDGK